jgi:hypothetical protein
MRRWTTTIPVALLAAAGCTHETFDPNVKKPSALFTSTEVKKPKDDGPKRQPKAETCTAYGNASEQSGPTSPISKLSSSTPRTVPPFWALAGC